MALLLTTTLPLLMVDFVSIECFTYNVKFYFDLSEFQVLKHCKIRYPSFPSLTDVTIMCEPDVKVYVRCKGVDRPN